LPTVSSKRSRFKDKRGRPDHVFTDALCLSLGLSSDLVVGREPVDIDHLPGDRSIPKTVEWMVKAVGEAAPKVVIKAISEKGSTDTKKLNLDMRK